MATTVNHVPRARRHERRTTGEVSVWLTRGLAAALSLGVTIAAVPRLGTAVAAELLVAIAGAQVLAAVLVAPVSTYSLRGGAQGWSIRSTEVARLMRVAIWWWPGVAVVVLLVSGASGRLGPLVVAIVAAAYGIGASRVVSEWLKGQARPIAAILIDNGPGALGGFIALAIGRLPVEVFGGFTCVTGIFVLLAASLSSGREKVEQVAPSRSHSAAETIGLTIVPLGILAATYMPLLWLRFADPGDAGSVASYALLQRSLAPVTIGLGVVATIYLPQVLEAHGQLGRYRLVRLIDQSRRFARRRVGPLAVSAGIVAWLTLTLAGLDSAESMAGGSLLVAAQMTNVSVGIPTEINVTTGAVAWEVFGVVSSMSVAVTVLAILGGRSPLVAAGLAVLVAQIVRNTTSHLNLRSQLRSLSE